MTALAAQITHAGTEPFRVGLIGLNRQGWHLIERCLSGGPFQVVKVYDVIEATVACGIEETITSPDIDVAWIAHPIALQSDGLPPDLIERLLTRGKHVVVEAPLSLCSKEAERLMAIARQSGRHLLVHSPRHADEAIRQTLAAVNCQELGAILAAKWISWSYAIPLVANTEQRDGTAKQADDLRVVLVRQIAHVLDQLVQLIPVAPLRVFAIGDPFGEKESCLSPTLAAWIEFLNGAQAEIDFRLNSPAPLHTGWVIHSERGGVTDGRQFKLTSDGEVFDSPVAPIGPAVDDLVSLAEALHGQPSVSQTPTQTLAVVKLLEEIRQSACQTSPIIYPETDGEPIAENTVQYTAITTIKGNLDIQFANDPQVFVAADLFWYPVEGNNTLRTAPDTLVVFGVPKGDRGSYRQWEENNIPPQVVFEVLSPGNRIGEMIRKFNFYDERGVEEYYVFDPDDGLWDGWIRQEGRLRSIVAMQGWVSPRLGIRFESGEDNELRLFRADGQRFLSMLELEARRCEAEARSELDLLAREQAQQRADQAQQRAAQEQQRAERAERRAELLAAKLREAGIELVDE